MSINRDKSTVNNLAKENIVENLSNNIYTIRYEDLLLDKRNPHLVKGGGHDYKSLRS